MAAGIEKSKEGLPGDENTAGVSIFMLPSDLPVSLSPLDLQILTQAFETQSQSSVWCGFTVLEQKRTASHRGLPARAVMFVTGARLTHLVLARNLGGEYTLCDQDNQIVHSDISLARLLRIFQRRRGALH